MLSLSQHLYRGIENIQAGIGTQAGLLIQDISIFISGIVWAFFINWKLAFVVLTMLPVLSVAAGLNVRVRIIVIQLRIM